MNYNFFFRPISLKQANEFVSLNHRHNKPVAGHKFSIGLFSNEKLIGVAICGRPVARMADDGLTLEVLRVCTDGTRNANCFIRELRKLRRLWVIKKFLLTRSRKKAELL